MPLTLQPGLRLVRRDADHLQLGVDPPELVVLPDHPDVRVLVDDLVRGQPCGRLSEVAMRALSRIVASGLARPAGHEHERRRRLASLPVEVVASTETSAALAPLLSGAGLVPATSQHRVAALVVADAEVSRGALDPLVRDGVPHLVVTGSSATPVVGPFVVPGTTACVRCVDAHRGEHDPRRALVVEQLASVPPLTSGHADVLLRSIALAWAVRDVVTFLEGGRPSTWSATVRVDADLAPAPRVWLRHPHCGCSWAEGLATVV